MHLSRYIGFCYILLHLLILSKSAHSQTIALPDSSRIERYDTVYEAPDTIKSTRVDTVFEYYEETPTIISTKAKAKVKLDYMIEPIAGFGLTRIYPQYSKNAIVTMAGIQALCNYKNVFLSASIQTYSQITGSVSFTKQYTSYRKWIDTIKTVLDEYIQIIGKDTIKTQVIKKTYIPKTDTTHSDTAYSHKNSYSTIQIPILIGYLYKMKKTWISLGVGPNVKITKENSLNKLVLGDSSFVSETSYFKKLTIDLAFALSIKQKIMKNIWLSSGISGSIALQSNLQSYNKALNQSTICLNVGINYYFRL
jgi:hypothetical protein